MSRCMISLECMYSIEMIMHAMRNSILLSTQIFIYAPFSHLFKGNSIQITRFLLGVFSVYLKVVSQIASRKIVNDQIEIIFVLESTKEVDNEPNCLLSSM